MLVEELFDVYEDQTGIKTYLIQTLNLHSVFPPKKGKCTEKSVQSQPKAVFF